MLLPCTSFENKRQSYWKAHLRVSFLGPGRRRSPVLLRVVRSRMGTRVELLSQTKSHRCKWWSMRLLSRVKELLPLYLILIFLCFDLVSLFSLQEKFGSGDLSWSFPHCRGLALPCASGNYKGHVIKTKWYVDYFHEYPFCRASLFLPFYGQRTILS